MSLNAWPSHKWSFTMAGSCDFLFLYAPYQQVWNNLETLTLPWREKVAYCEDVYKRLGSPAIFKISPLVSPDLIILSKTAVTRSSM